MKPRKDGDQAFLNDIMEACALLLANTQHKQLPDFVADRFFQHAVANLLANIGEAAKNISPATRELYPTVEWRDMIRLRDKFVHSYWAIDPLKMWNIVKKDVPKLMEILQS
jgi:uncharacterized protein with HEPN domain